MSFEMSDREQADYFANEYCNPIYSNKTYVFISRDSDSEDSDIEDRRK